MHKEKLTNVNPPQELQLSQGFLQCFQDKGGSHAHIRADPGSGNH